MTELDYPAFDADNHYYEALDAFTRYVDPKMQPRCVQWCEVNGRKYHVVGGIVSHAVVNPTFDPVAKPGSLQAFFKGTEQSAKDVKSLFGELEPIRAEYRQRDARLWELTNQNLYQLYQKDVKGYVLVLQNINRELCRRLRRAGDRITQFADESDDERTQIKRNK